MELIFFLFFILTMTATMALFALPIALFVRLADKWHNTLKALFVTLVVTTVAAAAHIGTVYLFLQNNMELTTYRELGTVFLTAGLAFSIPFIIAHRLTK